MAPKIIRKIAKSLGYVQVAQFLQNIFRTRYATDMYIAQVQVVSKTHEKTFGEYKNKHYGKDVAVIATGPSLNNYKPIPNTINIGVNKTIFCKNIKLNYYFSHDYLAVKDYIKELINYPDVKKFYGVIPQTHYGFKSRDSRAGIFPESLIVSHNASKYYLYSKQPVLPVPFSVDIDKTWLADGGSCIFGAMQFALFTNPKKIYLVGCDCSSGYHLINTWQELKRFVEVYYPETEIISVNPVGLKGLFTDLYQE